MGSNNNRGSSPRYRKYSVKEDFFATIDSTTKAYCLGLMYSDGNVSSSLPRIKFNSKDMELIVIFKEALHSEHPVEDRNGQFCLAVNSRRMKADLIALGCIPNKSLVVEYPTIPTQFDNSFIRGLVDGDDHFRIRIENKVSSNGTRHSYQRLRFHFCGAEKLVEAVANKINVYLGFQLRVHSRGSNYYIETAGQQAASIHSYLYKESVLHLSRKAGCGRIITLPL